MSDERKPGCEDAELRAVVCNARIIDKETGRDEDCLQVSWSTAEVVYEKHGEPFNGDAAVRQGIVRYHQNGDGDEN